MRSVPVALVVVALAVIAACVPTRDNPNDPVNAPRAQLKVLDYTTQAGCLPARIFDSSSAEPIVPIGLTTPIDGPAQALSAADLGDCLALSAEGTFDPRGTQFTPLLRYSFFLSTSAQGQPQFGPFLSYPLATSGTGATVAIVSTSYSFRHSLPLQKTIYFQVVVKGVGGTESTATAPFTFFSLLPVAKAGAPKSMPLGGFPWAPGAPISVPVSGSQSQDTNSINPSNNSNLEYCWSSDPSLPVSCPCCPQDPGYVPSTTTQCVTGSGGNFSLKVPTTQESRQLAQLAVFNGSFCSSLAAPALQEVDVRAPQIWIEDGAVIGNNPATISGGIGQIASSEDPSVPVQFVNSNVITAPSLFRLTNIGTGSNARAAGAPSEVVIAVGTIDGDQEVAISAAAAPGVDFLPAVTLTTGQFGSVAVTQEGSLILASGAGNADGGLTATFQYSVALVGSNLTLQQSTASLPPLPLSISCLTIPCPSSANGPPVLAVDGQETIWMGNLVTTALVISQPGGTQWTQADSFSGQSGLGLNQMLVRPSVGDVWTLWAPPPPGPGSGGGPLPDPTLPWMLARYPAGGAAAPQTFDVPAGISGIGWVNSDLFWAEVPGVGLQLISAETLLLCTNPTTAFITSTVLTLPQVQTNSAVVAVEPSTGAAWSATSDLSGQDALVFRSTLSGTVQQFLVTGQQVQPQFVDGLGALWYLSTPSARPADDATVIRSFSPGTSTEIALPLVMAATLDPSTGGGWAFLSTTNSTDSPPVLVQFAADGTVARSVPSVLSGTSSLQVPFPSTTLEFPFGTFGAMDPDGTGVWVFLGQLGSATEIDHLSLNTDPMEIQEVIDLATTHLVQDSESNQQPMLQPSANTQPRFAWVFQTLLADNPPVGQVQQLSLDGTLSANSFETPGTGLVAGDFLPPASALFAGDDSLCVAFLDSTGSATLHVVQLDKTTLVPRFETEIPGAAEAMTYTTSSGISFPAKVLAATSVDSSNNAYCWLSWPRTDGNTYLLAVNATPSAFPPGAIANSTTAAGFISSLHGIGGEQIYYSSFTPSCLDQNTFGQGQGTIATFDFSVGASGTFTQGSCNLRLIPDALGSP